MTIVLLWNDAKNVWNVLIWIGNVSYVINVVND